MTDFFHSHGLLSLGCVLYPLVAGKETHAMSIAPKFAGAALLGRHRRPSKMPPHAQRRLSSTPPPPRYGHWDGSNHRSNTSELTRGEEPLPLSRLSCGCARKPNTPRRYATLTKTTPCSAKRLPSNCGDDVAPQLNAPPWIQTITGLRSAGLVAPDQTFRKRQSSDP